jgi:hypothetical protein
MKIVMLYSYDTNAEAFATGNGYSTSPPTDYIGEKPASEEIRQEGPAVAKVVQRLYLEPRVSHTHKIWTIKVMTNKSR